MAASQVAVETGRVRKDPRPRHLSGGQPQLRDGTPAWLRLKNKDETRKYVFVYLAGSGSNSVEYYESLGYVGEKYKGPDGLNFVGGRTARKIGEDLTFRGMLVMSCDAETAAEIELNGPDGQTGQTTADTYENLIYKKKTGLRGEAFAKGTVRNVAGDVLVGEDRSRAQDED